MASVMRSFLGFLALLSFSIACSGQNAKSESIKASGTIQLGGVPQEVLSCAMTGASHQLTLSLTLKNGATVILPIHESTVKLRADKASTAETLACSKSEKDGSGSEQHYAGDISLSCGAGEAALVMELHIECGVAPVSNRDPDDKGPTN